MLRSELVDRGIVHGVRLQRFERSSHRFGIFPLIGENTLVRRVQSVLSHEPEEFLQRRPPSQVQFLVGDIRISLAGACGFRGSSEFRLFNF